MEPHSPAQLSAVRDVLVALREELLGLLADETGATKTVELDQAVQGRLSRMDAIQHQRMAQAHRRRAELRLKRIEAVLESYDEVDGEFGCCRDCGEPISMARLHARPDALFCVSCQEARG